MSEDYRKARRRGLKEVSRAYSSGRNPYPPVLDEQAGNLPVACETSIGCMEIPVDLVVGTRTAGRANVFSAGFMPLADEGSEFSMKWSQLLKYQVSEGMRDPIVVFECLHRFFVQEGNKRVSVSRYLGTPTILAQVTRVVPVLTPDMDQELEVYEAFERFFAVCPLYEIDLSGVRDYDRLAALFGRDLKEPWPDEDVRRLKASYYQFRDAYLKRRGDALDLSVADAFLRYLETYTDAAKKTIATKEVDQRLKAMWDEFVVAEKDEPVVFVDEPRVAGDARLVTKAISKVKRTKRLSVAFIYDRTPETSGWVRQFEARREELADRMGDRMRFVTYEGCATDVAFTQAVEAAIADGCAMVVTASPRQMVNCRRAAVAHRDVQFLNCSVMLSSGTVRSFYARMYEVKFCLGALAATLSDTHQLGYVASSPINGAVAEVNAFALGAAMVDPKAVVHLRWRTGIDDWRAAFSALGVDMVSGIDYPDPVRPDEPFGLCAIKEGKAVRVACPVWEWGRYLELMLSTVAKEAGRADVALEGRAINYWWGMRTGVVRLVIEEGLAMGQRHLVSMLCDAICRDSLKPFDTLLVDQEGTIVRDEGDPALTDDQIASMNWLNINVAGSLPADEELTDDGKADVAASGVTKPVAHKS